LYVCVLHDAVRAGVITLKKNREIMKNKLVLLTLASGMLIGCAGPMNHTERGAATGAVLGGLLGAVIGHNKGRKTAEGAAIGALGGAVLGGALGNRQDKQTGNK
jgi:uncharacterized protein YcfJ